MRPPRVIFIFVLTLVFCSTLTAQQAPQRDPQAVAVALQSYSLMASAAPYVQDAVAEGQMQWADGTSGKIVFKGKGRDRLRHEITRPSGELTYVISQGKGFSLRDGKREQLPLWVTAYQRPAFIPAFFRLVDYARPETKLTYLGAVEVAGRPAHHIRISALPKDGTPPEIEELISEYHVFIDFQTLLPVKTITFDFSPEIIENRTPVETYFSDFRSVGGLLIPYRITRYIWGQKDSDITLTNVRLNVGLSDGDFQ